MSAEPEGNSELSADTALGKFKVTSPNMNMLFTVLTFVAALWAVWLVMEQRAEAKAREDKLASAITEMAMAQREMNCLTAMPQDKREREYNSQNSFCKQMARLR